MPLLFVKRFEISSRVCELLQVSDGLFDRVPFVEAIFVVSVVMQSTITRRFVVSRGFTPYFLNEREHNGLVESAKFKTRQDARWLAANGQVVVSKSSPTAVAISPGPVDSSLIVEKIEKVGPS